MRRSGGGPLRSSFEMKMPIAILSFWIICGIAGGLAASAAETAVQTAPKPALVLKMLEGPSESEKRLALFKDSEELGSIEFPPGVSSRSIEDGLKRILWHPNGQDLAVAFIGEKNSFIVVFLRNQAGKYLAVDVSQVENGNFGKLGREFRRKDFATLPTQWLPRPDNDNLVQVVMRTRVWDLAGRRYTVTEPLVITRDGKPLWR